MGPYEVTKSKRNDRYDVKKVADFEGPNATSTSCDYMKPWKRDDLSGTEDYVEWPNVEGQPERSEEEKSGVSPF